MRVADAATDRLMSVERLFLALATRRMSDALAGGIELVGVGLWSDCRLRSVR
jgi:hypothetical protein